MKTVRQSLLWASGLAVIAGPAHAASFNIGGIDAIVDTTLSAGVSFRAESPDDSQIAISNGGLARSANGDDGNIGYKTGDVVSSALKATVDADLRLTRDSGFFFRATSYYNPEAEAAGTIESRLAANDGAGRSRARGEAELGEQGHSRQDFEFDLLDAFYYGKFKPFGQTVNVTAGNVVVSWGESTFIANGINVINPINVPKFRLPGSQIREALTPLAAITASMPLTDNFSAELLWQMEWDRIDIDPRGSYFSTNDFASDGGTNAVVSFGRRQDDNSRPIKDPRTDPEQGGDPENGDAQVWLPRLESELPDQFEANQYGFALRYFADWLNATEFGLYYLRYHSRIPLLSAIRGGTTNALNGAAPLCSESVVDGCRGAYFAEYPEGINLYGLSFNTDGPFGVALQGEISHRPDVPLQLGGTEVFLSAVGVPGASVGTFNPGDRITGYETTAVTQAQVTGTKAFGPSFGAMQWVLLGEIGFTYQDLSDSIFNGPGAGLPSCRTAEGLGAETQAAILAQVSNGSCQEAVGGGYATKTSWGYRMVSRLDYTNVFDGVNLSPRMVFFHDVNGVSGSFNEDAKILGLGVSMDYLQVWTADISYTMYFGERLFAGEDTVAPGTPGFAGVSSQPQNFATSSNPSADRDFVALSVTYSF